MKTKHIIFIVGPTAVGKSRLAINLAKKIDGEIISCDSMQVYIGLDILSCKPSRSEMKQVRHHLVDVVSPGQNFDVCKFIRFSKRLIEEIHDREKIPIFAGGTGLYVDCLLNGIFEGPKSDPKIRKALIKKANRYGNSYLYGKLKAVDRAAAEKIHIHDLRRIIRALEVYQITKKPLSLLQKQRKGIIQDRRFKIDIFGLELPRAALYENINKRVDEMFCQGAVKEVKAIFNRRCSKTFRQALGIKEVNLYLKGQIPLEQAKQLLKRNTRRYAKRQMTWFRKNPKIQWLDGKGALANILKLVKIH